MCVCVCVGGGGWGVECVWSGLCVCGGQEHASSPSLPWLSSKGSAVCVEDGPWERGASLASVWECAQVVGVV